MVDWLSRSAFAQTDPGLRIFCIRLYSKFARFLPVVVFTGT